MAENNKKIENLDFSDQVIYTTQKSVACDGGGGNLGHPLVWLHLGDDNQIVCPYCSRHFVLSSEDSLGKSR